MRINNVSISLGNIKMGDIPSVSLPPIKTCAPNVPCAKDCYACRMCRTRSNVRKSYEDNLTMYYEYPTIYEESIETFCLTQAIFRWNVSGDIPDYEYLFMMVDIARNCPVTRFFAFTKKFDLVNEYLAHENLPENLVIIFSAWKGLKLENPYNLPVAHVIERDGTTTAEKIENVCPGHCIDCLMAGKGCWTLKKGEIVCLGKH